MRKMQIVVIVLLLMVIGAIGFGFYRDWFSFSSSTDSDAGRTVLQLTIEQEKIKADYQLAREKVVGGAAQAKEEGK